MNGGVSDILAEMHFYRHRFPFYPFGEIELFQDTLELGGKGFIRLEAFNRGIGEKKPRGFDMVRHDSSMKRSVMGSVYPNSD